MSHSTLRPVIKLRSTAGTGYTYVTRKSRRNDPDRLVIRKYDPVAGRHVDPLAQHRLGDDIPQPGQYRQDPRLGSLPFRIGSQRISDDLVCD